MTILTTGNSEGFNDKKGISLLEFLVVIFIFSLFLIPTMAFFQRRQQTLLLESAAKCITSTLQLARNYALHERKTIKVIFKENTFSIYAENGKDLIGKENKLPLHIVMKEKTNGFDPVVFSPDGTAKQAGHLILLEENSKREKKIILYNITGKCIVE